MGSETAGPRALRDLWLRFHEKELCQDLDTVFIFHQRGMEIWCLVEDGKSYQKFAEMIEPHRTSFEIDVYVTRPSPEKKSSDDKDPPPSLWNNTVLQANLNESSRLLLNSESTEPLREFSLRSFSKQRLIMWADQILSWNKKVRRYAADLPELARQGFGPGVAHEIRSHAAAVCMAHAQALDKHVARLMDGLAQALPKPEKAARHPEKVDKPRLPSLPVELALLASTHSLAVAKRVFNFIYPQEYTVELTDLKEPGLLDSLRNLRTMLSELQKVGAIAR